MIMLERLNEEIKRRTQVVRIFPNAQSCLRLIRALASRPIRTGSNSIVTERGRITRAQKTNHSASCLIPLLRPHTHDPFLLNLTHHTTPDTAEPKQVEGPPITDPVGE
jgi:hypothetical protein